MGKRLDLTGQRFGRLFVIKVTEQKRGGSYLWKCKCDCGNEVLASVSELNSGNKKSCGCMTKISVIEYYKDGTYLFNLNDKVTKNNTSGFKGVSWEKHTNKWHAYIMLRGKQKNLGRFTNKQDAINARKEAEEKYFKPILEKYGKTQ